MLKSIGKLVDWFEERSGVIAMVRPMMDHHVPRDAKWFYVFGSATLMFFTIQILTGICLALVYTPDAGSAWQNLVYINEQVPFGW